MGIIRLANMGNRQVADEIGKLLDVKGISLKEVRETVEEFADNLDDAAREESNELRGFVKALIRRCGGTLPEDEPKGTEKAELRANYAAEKDDPRRSESAPDKKDKKDVAKDKKEKKDK